MSFLSPTQDVASLVENCLLEVNELLRREDLLDRVTYERGHGRLLALYERAQDASNPELGRVQQMQRRRRIVDEARVLGKEIKAEISSKRKEILLSYHQETKKLDLFIDGAPTSAEVRRLAKVVLRDSPDFSHGLSNLTLEDRTDELHYRATALRHLLKTIVQNPLVTRSGSTTPTPSTYHQSHSLAKADRHEILLNGMGEGTQAAFVTTRAGRRYGLV